MKTYVLMISERFPQGHPKAGAWTEFPRSIKHYDKIHTIRGNYEFWNRRITEVQAGKAYLSVRVWVGKPYGKGSKAVEVFRFDKTHGVGIEALSFLDGVFEVPRIGNLYPKITDLAKNDGLIYSDFEAWFRNYDLRKEMAIIHFTPFRYQP